MFDLAYVSCLVENKKVHKNRIMDELKSLNRK